MRAARLLTAGIAVTVAAISTTPVWALDKIKLTKGNTINGTIEAMSPKEVSVKRTNDAVDKIPVNEIESISFDQEPPQMNIVRSAAAAGRYEDVLRTLEKVAADPDKLSDNLKPDVAFYRALAAARLALAGNGDISAAGPQMREFVQKNPDNYHFLDATEVLGDLFTSLGKHDLAQQQFEVIERTAPWNDVKMRAKIAKGHALRWQAKSDAALKEFDAALALAGSDKTPTIETQRQAATLGKAACLADAKQYDAAVKLVEGVIAAADPEAVELHARAYNTLGSCYRQAGKTKEALLAFLRVDILYPTLPQAHAEALENLAELWPAAGHPQRAAQAQEMLKTRYPNKQRGKG